MTWLTRRRESGRESKQHEMGRVEDSRRDESYEENETEDNVQQQEKGGVEASTQHFPKRISGRKRITSSRSLDSLRFRMTSTDLRPRRRRQTITASRHPPITAADNIHLSSPTPAMASTTGSTSSNSFRDGMLVGTAATGLKLQQDILLYNNEKNAVPAWEATGVIDEVQEHEGNKNLSLLNEAYVSIFKGKNFPAPGWRQRGLNRNDLFFQQQTPQGNTVLHIAARFGNDDMVQEIVQKAPQLLRASNHSGDSPLHVAAREGHISTLTKLFAFLLQSLPFSYSEHPREALDAVLENNLEGNTFFHEALLNGHKGVMNFLASDETPSKDIAIGFKELVELVALMFKTNGENKSVLYLAIEGGFKEIVNQALAKLVNIDPALDEFIKKHKELEEVVSHHDHGYLPTGKSPLLAAIMKRDLDMLQIILTSKPEWIHLRDVEGRVPLHYAASIGYLEGVRYLLGICTSCTTESDKYGFFPLHLASYKGHVDVVHKLLEHCMDPREMRNINTGQNVLHIAIEKGQFNVVRYILKSDDPELEKMINDKDGNRNTPLHLAALRCYPKIVHALTWDERVDLTLVNLKGQTALDAFLEKFQQYNPSLRQQLTWVALKSGGVRSAEPPCAVEVPPETTQPYKEESPDMSHHKDSMNTLILVSTLIITVTFAAGFTLPGGTNSSESDPGKGMALMLNYLWFKIFIFCITVSMYGAICVTIILIWTQLGDITLATFALDIARPVLGVTLATLSIAFMAGVHLVISDISWLAATIMVMSVVFILTLVFLYILLWFPSASSVTAVRYFSKYPFEFFAWLAERRDGEKTR